ncbi:UNVERIFIED_CONTAM: Disease resistance protein RPM1 [Sesamum radiatum]|uniref:Disease resistance protein RPM1 n=1 Tax=Sesamum radiatum TaxID=300843 RepID=A0AAW2PIS2_SESRA
MDDVWSIKAWNALKLFFPNNAKGSRVMVTTRESNLAISLGSHESYSIDFLNEDKSWNLFCHKAFSQEGCPYSDLEEIGKNIARSCHGLPLTITVIGGLLAKSNMTREYWESIAENMLTFVFQTNQLWIAEGFLKPINGQSLDEVAEIYLRYLIDRNLILSLKFGWMYHGPCFFCGLGKALRRIDLNEVHDASQLTSLARVLVCNICKSMYSSLTRASDAFKGPEWNQDEGEFSRLKVLRNDHHLERWSRRSLPSLEHLILTGMAKLTEIPSCIGYTTLGSIDLKCCHDSVIELAKQIVEEQHDNGNESLQLYINQERYHIGSL